MTPNPYESPASETLTPPEEARNFRYIAIALAGFACIIGYIYLTPFLTTPIAVWGWQNWWFGFAPAAYLVFASAVAVPTEWYAKPAALGLMPLVLSPLFLVTGLIGYVFYLDFANIFTGLYLLLALLCPLIWGYFGLALHRSWLLIRKPRGQS